MVLKRNTVKKLASLSAFGAGVLAAGAQDAQATVIFSGTINAKVGFDVGNGFGAGYTSPALGAGGPHFKFTAQSGFTANHVNSFKKILFNNAGGLNFAAGGSGQVVAQVFSAGATWGAAAGFGNGLVESRFIGGGHTPFAYSLAGPGPFTNKYFLINFGPGNSLYGWIQATLAVSKSSSSSGTFGPNLTIINYAFDDTGFKLAAGSTVGAPPPSSTPEPSTFGMLALGALAFGAAGVRRWRAAKVQDRSSD